MENRWKTRNRFRQTRCFGLLRSTIASVQTGTFVLRRSVDDDVGQRQRSRSFAERVVASFSNAQQVFLAVRTNERTKISFRLVYLERIQYIQRGAGSGRYRSAKDFQRSATQRQNGEAQQKHLMIYFQSDRPRSDYLYKMISFQLSISSSSRRFLLLVVVSPRRFLCRRRIRIVAQRISRGDRRSENSSRNAEKRSVRTSRLEHREFLDVLSVGWRENTTNCNVRRPA